MFREKNVGDMEWIQKNYGRTDRLMVGSGGLIQSKEHVKILTCNQRTAPPLRELLSWRRFRYGDPRSPSSPWRSSLG